MINSTCKGTKLVTRNQDIKLGQSDFASWQSKEFLKVLKMCAYSHSL